ALAHLARADVGAQRQRAPALRLDDPRRLLRIVALEQIDDRHVGAFAREQRRHRAADAAVAAGDDRDLAVEAAGAGMERLPGGLWLELALVAGQAVLVDHFYDIVAHAGRLLVRPAPRDDQRP